MFAVNLLQGANTLRVQGRLQGATAGCFGDVVVAVHEWRQKSGSDRRPQGFGAVRALGC
jgi:hypothetical protein